MSDQKSSIPAKSVLLVQGAASTKPATDDQSLSRNTANPRISQRGLLSVLTLVLSLGALTTALTGGARMILDILNDGIMNNLHLVWAKSIVLALAYIFGWLAAATCIRIYGNLILPTIIRLYSWVTLCGVSILYIAILQRLFKQAYDLPHYWAYLMMTAAGLAALVGLHLILEEHDLRPYAIPLFLLNLAQLALIVVRYVFIPDPNAWYLWGDLFFFAMMLAVPALMLAHLGVLSPYRRKITTFFESHAAVIRAES